MLEVSGEFDIHITVRADQGAELAAFATAHGVKFVHIVLDRGRSASQPMLNLRGQGTLQEQWAAVRSWNARLKDAGLFPVRAKVEATPWSSGVPATDEDAPADRYFEHHVKLLLPESSMASLFAITDLVTAYGARLSRNARRKRSDGGEERFVTQRCHGVGRATATERLDALTAAIRAAGHTIVEVEQEYVVSDTDLSLDQGWLDEPPSRTRSRWVAPRGDYPPTFRPLPEDETVRQGTAFDPSVKQYVNAYRAAEPDFLDVGAERRWRRSRRTALNRILEAIAGSAWGGHLVLRGSVTMAAWVGDAAREPGDLDFVVTPEFITSGSGDAAELLSGVKNAVSDEPGEIAESAIWTYERADGRRLAVPFDGGHVQVDIVFGEHLPLEPSTITLPGVGRPVLAASAPLSLAWKLLWLATDRYPQGKDLYDAVLLAEHTEVERSLVRDLMRPELGDEADDFTAESVIRWRVDRDNFADEYPAVTGTALEWQRRLSLALDRAWGA